MRAGWIALQRLPSQVVAETTQPITHVEGWRPKPRIVELLNMADYTHQARGFLGCRKPYL